MNENVLFPSGQSTDGKDSGPLSLWEACGQNCLIISTIISIQRPVILRTASRPSFQSLEWFFNEIPSFECSLDRQKLQARLECCSNVLTTDRLLANVQGKSRSFSLSFCQNISLCHLTSLACLEYNRKNALFAKNNRHDRLDWTFSEHRSVPVSGCVSVSGSEW